MRRTEEREVVGVDWDVCHLVWVTQLQRVLVARDKMGENRVSPFVFCPKIVPEGAGDVQESVEVMPISTVEEAGKDRGLTESV